jgi:hypothetical protein
VHRGMVCVELGVDACTHSIDTCGPTSGSSPWRACGPRNSQWRNSQRSFDSVHRVYVCSLLVSIFLSPFFFLSMSTSIAMHHIAAASDDGPIRWHIHAGEEQGALLGPVGSADSDRPTSADDDEIVCRVKKYSWSPPVGFENHAYRPHQGEGSQYLRDFILGVNDGIISTFLVVVGLVAGGADVTTTLLSAISAAVAGAISMGLGEYIATKSQENVNQGEFQLEVSA